MLDAFACLLAVDDPAGLPGPVLAESLVALDGVQRMVDAVRVAHTRAFVRSGDWAVRGYRSARSWLVANTTVAGSQAAAWVRVSEALADMAVTAASVAAGRLGFAKAALLVTARSGAARPFFDDQEGLLVETVEGLTVDGARAYLRAWRLRAVPDDGEPGPDGDRLRLSITFAGRGVLDGEYCAENTAILEGAAEALIDSWHRDGLLDDDPRTRPQLFAAAVLELVRRGADRAEAHRDIRPLVLATVDHRTLAGQPVTDPADAASRVCDLDGVGPVPVETIHRLLCDGDVCRVVHNGASMPLDVGRRERLATADQWRALLAVAHGTCEWPGCTAPHSWCQAHHPQVWHAPAGSGGSGSARSSKDTGGASGSGGRGRSGSGGRSSSGGGGAGAGGGETNIANLVLVCHRHHHAVHEGHFTIERTPTGIQARDPHGNPVEPPRYRHRPN